MKIQLTKAPTQTLANNFVSGLLIKYNGDYQQLNNLELVGGGGFKTARSPMITAHR